MRARPRPAETALHTATIGPTAGGGGATTIGRGIRAATITGRATGTTGVCIDCTTRGLTPVCCIMIRSLGWSGVATPWL